MTRNDILQKFGDLGLIKAEDVEYDCWITPNRSHIINIDHNTENRNYYTGDGILVQRMDGSEMGRWHTYKEGIEIIKNIIREEIDP